MRYEQEESEETYAQLVNNEPKPDSSRVESFAIGAAQYSSLGKHKDPPVQGREANGENAA